MQKTVLVPISDGVEEMEAVIIIDILRRAQTHVTVASVGKDLAVTASRGVKLVADVQITDCVDNTYDLIVLPGGMPGAEHLRDCEILCQMLKAQECSGRLFAAICAAPAVVLQEHGLLKSRSATCYPSLIGEIKENATLEQKVVVDGICVTSQGPGSAMEFALKLIELLCGSEKKNEVAQALLV